MERKVTTLQPVIDYDHLWERLFRGKYVEENTRSRRFLRFFIRTRKVSKMVDEALV